MAERTLRGGVSITSGGEEGRSSLVQVSLGTDSSAIVAARPREPWLLLAQVAAAPAGGSVAPVRASLSSAGRHE